MKHPKKLTLILICLFLVSQILGLFVINNYSPKVIQVDDGSGNYVNVTKYNLPYGTEPPGEINPKSTLFSIIFSIVIAIVLISILMNYKADIIMRVWFFAVVSLALGITINSFILDIAYSSLIALVIALPLAYYKIFKRNIIIHNLSEVAIYPGIAAIFIPLLNIPAMIILLIIISIYDMYAVWHSGFMQKMAKYQMEKLRIFAGFLVPYVNKKDVKIKNIKKGKNLKVSVAILGGGDVVFPLILAGIVLIERGLISALIVTLGATLALSLLFYYSEKGKFYPAMPFITAGCLVFLGLSYLI